MSRLTTLIVPPDGPLDADICFIGQSPGAEEDLQGRPFIGAAGQLLNRSLKSVGIVRSQALVNNVFCQRPPRNNVKYFFEQHLKKLTPEGQEHVDRLEAWLQKLLLQRERSGRGPKVLVALGAEAMWVLTGKKRITKWRGSILPCTLVEGFKVYCMFHPSYVNRLMNEKRENLMGEKKKRQQNALPLFLIDLDRVKYQAGFKEIRQLQRESIINATYPELINLLQNHTCNTGAVAVDIETLRGEDNTLVWCVGFAESPTFGFTVPFIRSQQQCWTIHEEAELWKEISKIFLNPNVSKIFQNGGYDLSILGRYYGLRTAPDTYQDTMWCHQATYPQMEKSLHVLTSIYTWEPYYKDDGKWWDGRRISDEAEFNYNVKDCQVTREIWPEVKRTAKQNGCWQTYLNSERSSQSRLGMMIQGVKINEDRKKTLGEDFNLRSKKAEANLQAEVGSSSQLQALVYGYLGLPLQYNHKTKKPSLDKDSRTRLLRTTNNNVAKVVLKSIDDFKKYNKLANTYTQMEVESDGRVRTNYGFVSTFRLSSSESHFGSGGNLQNIPMRTAEGRLIRELFIPDQGYVFIASDLGQAEAREVAWLSGDLELIEAFESGEVDVHWENARRIFGAPLEYNKEEEFTSSVVGIPMSMYNLRRIGKTVVYAYSYGMGPMMLQTILAREDVYFEAKVCRRLLFEVARARPMIALWHKQVQEEIRTTRTLFNAFGDKREFRGRLNDDMWRAAYAWRPQSTVGRILEFAIERLFRADTKFEPLLNVHDEVVGQLPEGEVERTIPIIRQYMEIPHEVNGRELVIPADFSVGENWGQMKEVEI